MPFKALATALSALLVLFSLLAIGCGDGASDTGNDAGAPGAPVPDATTDGTADAGAPSDDAAPGSGDDAGCTRSTAGGVGENDAGYGCGDAGVTGFCDN